jgi:L-threonylcarbamoyladenylate synthase
METSPPKSAIFFDRDGTLVEDRGHLRSPSDVVFFRDTLPALQRLKGRYLLFIVTHQSGIGLGLLSHEQVEAVNQHVVDALAQAGVTFSGVYTCPHTREEGCQCIKPNPHFLLKAAAEFNLDLSRCFVLGDHPHDVEMGRNVGARGIFLLTGHGQKHLGELVENPEVMVARNLDEAVTSILSEDLQRDQILQAAEIVRQGGIVAFPTETVYGLGADAFSPLAVARIFEVKRRPFFDPLIVHIASQDELKKLAKDVPSNAKRLMDRFWPGPLTVVLLKREDVPDLVTAGLPTVAIRVPNHPMALRLIETAQCPIAAPSANLFGHLSPTTAEHVREQLGDHVDFILDGGPCQVGVESTILSFVGETPRLLRPGGLALEEIESLIGPVEMGSSTDDRPLSPGMLPRHYAPRTPIVIDQNGELLQAYSNKKVGWLAFREPVRSHPFHHVEILSQKGDLREAAANLFAAIRRLDGLHLDLIVADSIPEVGLGRAIMDRLHRASQEEILNR